MTSTSSSATFDYTMPSLGADMDEGRVIEWRVAPGDTVRRGDLVAVVETEKSDIDIEIWHDGIVDQLLVDIGQLVDVGTPIARLRTVDGESYPEPTVSAPPPATRVAASPLARRLAADRGIELGDVRGSGPGGAVIEADILAASVPRDTPTGPDATARQTARTDASGSDEASRPADTMRQLIAERMSTANREIPHYHLARDLDVDALEAWLGERNADRPIDERVLPAACFIRAVALAAARHRDLNGWWVDDHFEPAESIDVAMAVSLRRGGLVTPRIEHADELSLDAVMAALTERVQAARRGNLRAGWMNGATITITHLGETGADLVHGVISPPQVALVGFGRTRRRPMAVDDEVLVRPVVTTTLAADHRATDGAIGSRFLATLAALIDHPEDL